MQERTGFLWSEREMHSIQLAARMRFSTRLVLWAFGRRLNRDLLNPLLCRAYSRALINSRALHELSADCDPTQPGVVGLATGLARPDARLQ